jgi:pentatricopeptide repeat protein
MFFHHGETSMVSTTIPRRQVDVFTYNNALSACVKSHKWQQTLQLFQDASEFAEKRYIYILYMI